jgi:acetolactate synthase-1/2/3 large subunit
MNGAQALIRTLVASGVEVCFTNPGTSEMHFVAALDTVEEMRGVLCLFEGVATGAADGYGRMAGRPAATLLHLGSGLGNGIANLHNARRAHTPVVNVVGDHAGYHLRYDPPLASDIASIAAGVSTWVRRSDSPASVATDAAEAVAAAFGPPGQVATLVLPADVSWRDGAEPAGPLAPVAVAMPDADRLAAAVKALRSGERGALLLGGRALGKDALVLADRIARATKTKLYAETFPARIERGAGIPGVERLGYLAEFMESQLAGLSHLVLVGARAPVSFFAYPNKPSYLVPEECELITAATVEEDVLGALEAIAGEVGEPLDDPRPSAARPGRPEGPLTAESVAQAIAAALPEGAIVSDESNTTGLFLAGATAGCPPHDVLTLTGGAIGQGLPVATGAALACPDRPVVAVEADGSAMYTFQALWTQAREFLNVTTVIMNNRSYAVLNMELNRVGAETPGPKARRMLDLTSPEIDFVSMARGMGVDAQRANSAGELCDLLGRSFREEGPHLIEAVVPSIIG